MGRFVGQVPDDGRTEGDLKPQAPPAVPGGNGNRYKVEYEKTELVAGYVIEPADAQPSTAKLTAATKSQRPAKQSGCEKRQFLRGFRSSGISLFLPGAVVTSAYRRVLFLPARSRMGMGGQSAGGGVT